MHVGDKIYLWSLLQLIKVLFIAENFIFILVLMRRYLQKISMHMLLTEMENLKKS